MGERFPLLLTLDFSLLSSGYTVRSKEESCRHMELQGLWQSQSRRCLHLEVRKFCTLSDVSVRVVYYLIFVNAI